MIKTSRDELTADFRQYYGLNLEDLGSAYSLSHAAILAAQLPSESRCIVKGNADASWNSETWMLWRIDFALSQLLHGMSGKHGSKKPKPLDTPSRAKRISNSIKKTDFESIADRLGVDYGN